MRPLHSSPHQGSASLGLTNISEAGHRQIVNKICQGPLPVSGFMGNDAWGRAVCPVPCGASPGIPVWGMAVAEKGIVGLDVCSSSTMLTGKQPVPNGV